MPNRITFRACIAYAWCLVEVPIDPDDDDSEVREERRLCTASGNDAVEAATDLAERFNLDPSTEARVIVLNIDADDPTAPGAEATVPGAEATVPAGAAPVATFDPSAHVKE